MPAKTAVLDRKVPDFTAAATGGTTFQLSENLRQALVIYFYPRDDTSGCTREGQAFRDEYAKFRRAGATIIGVSPDTLASHEKFKSKYSFPFELLSDVDKRVCGLFDVYKEKSMYGRKYLGVERSTFLIDSTGVLRREWRKVKVDGHVAEVLAAVKGL